MIDRPVDVVRLMRQGGLSLRAAHANLERIAGGETIAVDVQGEDHAMVVMAFEALGVTARLADHRDRDMTGMRRQAG